MKVTVIEIKHCQLKNTCNKDRPHLKDIINDLGKSDTWKIQLTIAINCISSNDNDEQQLKHWNCDNTEFVIYDNADEVTKEVFQSLFSRHQIGLETSMSHSDFIFDFVRLRLIISKKTQIEMIIYRLSWSDKKQNNINKSS